MEFRRVLFRSAEWVQTSLLFSAIGAPPLMLYTFHRRMNYQVGDPRRVLVMVLVHILSYALGIFAAYHFRDIETLPFLAFAFAPSGAALFGAIRFLGARQSVVSGMHVSVRVDLGGGRVSKKNKQKL